MNPIPKKSFERLILISSLLEKIKNKKITSSEIAEFLGCKDTLVRYDFKFLKLKNGVSNGYDVEELKSSINNFFNSDKNCKKCCVVGLGRLGEALLDDEIFYNSGFKIEAGFDSSVNRVELLRSTFELFPASRIETVCVEKKIDYAFLCCKDSEVERMISRLVNAKIKGIVNYTNSVLYVPEEIKIINASPVFLLKKLGF